MCFTINTTTLIIYWHSSHFKDTWSYLHRQASSAKVRLAAAQTGWIPKGILLQVSDSYSPYRTVQSAWTRPDHFHLLHHAVEWPSQVLPSTACNLGWTQTGMTDSDVTFWVRQTWLSTLPPQVRKIFSAGARDKLPAICIRNLVRFQVSCIKPPYILSISPPRSVGHVFKYTMTDREYTVYM